MQQLGARPIQFHPVPRGTPRWGAEWKKAVVDDYNHYGQCQQSRRGDGLPAELSDLDPTYTDAFGRPLLRMTFDFQDNEIKQINREADIAVQIAREMGAVKVDRNLPAIPYSIVPYQSTHNTGGAAIGVDPRISALNKYCRCGMSRTYS